MEYDVAILGAGPGGYVAAIRAAQLGGKVCLVEKGALGGTCLNRGCIPSKILLHGAKLYSSIRKAEGLGISAPAVNLDYSRIFQRKETVLGRLQKGIGALLRAGKISVLEGTARLAGRRQIVVASSSGETAVGASKVILATGSEAARPGAFPFDGKHVITSDEVFAWQELPGSILVVGGGPSGCELASAFRDLGAQVHLIEMLEQLLPGQDGDVSKELNRAFTRRGISVRTGVKIESMAVNGGRVRAVAGGESIDSDVAILCTGRKLNTAGIGLEALGVEMQGSTIVVNEHCQSNVPNIYAVGDITGKGLLAHLASRQGIVAASHAMGHEAAVDYRAVPACVFTDPEVAIVGITEAQAQQEGRKVKSVKYPFQALGKSQVLDEGAGFLKMVAEEGTGEILGFHIVGAHATELIGEATLALRLEATVEELAETLHAHPTLGEVYLEAAEMFLGLPIHAVAKP